MIRSLSFTEISTAMTCQAQHAFAYTGHLSQGDALSPKVLHPSLSGGRAWGAGVAAWHSQEDPDDILGRTEAISAVLESLRADVAEQQEKGVWVDLLSMIEAENRVSAILDHYMQSSDPMPFRVEKLEREIEFALPSRPGLVTLSGRRSNRYHFQGFLDAFVERRTGRTLVEYKLRKSLTDPDIIQIQPQTRWYALGDYYETGEIPEEVIVDERLSQEPKPPKIVKGRKKGTYTPSHDKAQWTTPEWYVAVCAEYDVEPHEDTIEALQNRRWQQRISIRFREDELRTAERELVSAAQMISELDSGRRYPIRNAQPRLCRPCKFRKICPGPEDRMFVDLYFDRKPPKRLRDVVRADSSSDPRSEPAGLPAGVGTSSKRDSLGSELLNLAPGPSPEAQGKGSHGSARSTSGQIPGQTRIEDFLS